MNPFTLTTEQLLGLEDQRPRLMAQADLQKACDGTIRLSPKGWYQLTLAATHDANAAEDAHNAAVQRSLKAGEQVGEVID